MSFVLVLYCARAPADRAGALERLLQALPYAKRLELEARDARARIASLAGIAMVLDGAERLTGRRPGPAELRFPQGRRPHLEGGPHFSVSHSGDRVGVALASDCEIGIDLECLPDDGSREATPRLQRWTATEAVLKAAGRGLRDAAQVELGDPPVTASLAGNDYRLCPVPLPGRVVAHLASSRPIVTVAIESWPGGTPA